MSSEHRGCMIRGHGFSPRLNVATILFVYGLGWMELFLCEIALLTRSGLQDGMPGNSTGIFHEDVFCLNGQSVAS